MLAGLGLAVVAALSLLAMLVMVRPHARRLTLAQPAEQPDPVLGGHPIPCREGTLTLQVEEHVEHRGVGRVRESVSEGVARRRHENGSRDRIIPCFNRYSARAPVLSLLLWVRSRHVSGRI